MPIYDLKCKICGREFTLMGSYKEKEDARCPQCGSPDLRQIYGAPSVKGTSSGAGGSCNSPRGFG